MRITPGQKDLPRSAYFQMGTWYTSFLRCLQCCTTDNPCTGSAKMLIPLWEWPLLQWELPQPRLCPFPGGSHIPWLLWGIQRSSHVAQFRATLEGHSCSRTPHGAGWNFCWGYTVELLLLPYLAVFTSFPVLFPSAFPINLMHLSRHQGVFSREAKPRHLTFHVSVF